jgi:ABC-type phosphate transport system substrate-binding protein
MRFVSLRRAVPVCAAATAAVALGLPGVASAAKAPKTDVSEQCSGAAKIEAEGSTFAAPAEFLWTGNNTEKKEELKTGFNFSTYKLGCNGSQGSKAKPEVLYNQENSFNRGSGSCLKSWGNGVTTFEEEKSGEKYPRLKKFSFCGTDEAPSEAVKEEFEKFASEGVEGEHEGQKGAAIESIPVAQGAVAMIVHKPKHSLASSEITTSKGKKEKLGRLALDQETVEGIYAGTIKTWAEAVAAQGGNGSDKLTCTEGGENDTITPVVREDKSGTTHIFKSFLEQVSTAKIPMENFEEIKAEGVGTGEKPCSSGELQEGAERTWENVAEGCENQRWPLAAHVLRPKETGNPGVVNKVNATESSIGYADLAVAQELKFFNPAGGGGEKKAGEQKKEFWAVVQNSEPGTTPVTFEDPSTVGDGTKEGDSNCKETKYILGKGEKFPPKSTRDNWSKVKAENVSKTYAICGVTYVLAARQYWFFLDHYGLTEEESKAVATTVHDYLQWVVSTGGGGKVLKDHDYEALPKAVAAESLLGAEEIGSKEG